MLWHRWHRLHRLRLRAPGGTRNFDHAQDLELTYTSNAIEGSTLTRSETAIVIEKGITIGGKPLRHHLEALDHMDALAFVRALARSREPFREGDIREIHRLVLARSDPSEAGGYSRHQRAVLGSTMRFPSPAELPALMGDFARWLRDAEPGPHASFEAHYRLVTIHPFSDGNGRSARLLMNLILLRGGYPPVVIGPEERAEYVDALQERQFGGGDERWTTFMSHRLDLSLTENLGHLASGLNDSGRV